VTPSQYLVSKIELHHLDWWLQEEEKEGGDDHNLDEPIERYFPIPRIEELTQNLYFL